MIKHASLTDEVVADLARLAVAGDRESFLSAWEQHREKMFAAVVEKIRSQNGLSDKDLAILTHAALWKDSDAFWMLGEAFKKFFTQKKIAKMIQPHSGSSDPEDLYGDALLKVYDALEKGGFNPTRSFFKFVSTTVYRHVLDHIYRSQREPNWTDVTGSDEGEGKKDIFEPPTPFMDNPEVLTQYLELFRLVCECCAKPHQILALCYVKLLEWPPREIVAELSDLTLDMLADRFFDDLFSRYEGLLHRDRFMNAFWPLVEKLNRLSKDCYLEPQYAEKIKGFKRVGDLILKFFYEWKTAASVSDWCDKVKNRTIKAFYGGTSCSTS